MNPIMKFIPTAIPDVVIVEPAVFGDDRGWFMESFNEAKFHQGLAGLGLPKPRPFVQDNHRAARRVSCVVCITNCRRIRRASWFA